MTLGACVLLWCVMSFAVAPLVGRFLRLTDGQDGRNVAWRKLESA